MRERSVTYVASVEQERVLQQSYPGLARCAGRQDQLARNRSSSGHGSAAGSRREKGRCGGKAAARWEKQQQQQHELASPVQGSSTIEITLVQQPLW